MTDRLTIKRPDDWHLHLRDGVILEAVLADTARHFGRAIVMPNLVPPVTSGADADAYRERILAALPKGSTFTPLMTLYLTETTSAEDVRSAANTGMVHAVKLYPAGATTNSDAGVRDIEAVYPVLDAMSEIGLPLLVHGEVVDSDVDIFDREAVFLDRVLAPLRERFANLKIVLEHVTTEDGVRFLQNAGPNTAGTITPHHLMINRNALFNKGLRPHFYCLPVAKRERHRLALVDAATGGGAQFFLGTDSAPHPDKDKETACGCAGIYVAPVTMSCLAQVFDDAGKIANLEKFVSLNGPGFYGLPVNDATLTMERSVDPATFPKSIFLGDNAITLFDPGVPLHWKVAD
jgi:dihydroorotase